MSNTPRLRSTHVATIKLPGMKAWIVKVKGVKIGVIRFRNDGLFWAVAGHERLGGYGSKLGATNAVIEATAEALA